MNAAPDSLIWKKNTNGITAKVPGLYRLAVGFFTHKVSSSRRRRRRSMMTFVERCHMEGMSKSYYL